MSHSLALNNFDLTLDIWHQTAYAIGCLVLFLLAWILTIRMTRAVKDRRRRQVTALWQSILEGCGNADQTTLPSLSRRHSIVVLYLWNDCYGSQPAESAARLIRAARQIGIDRFARQLLHARLLRRRILAIITLGRLRDQSAWCEISPLISHHNSFLAFHAVQALLLIDSEAAIPLVLPIIGHRSDWSPLKIVSILCGVGHDIASEAIAEAAITGDPAVGSRLIRHLPIAKSPRGLFVLRQFLRKQASISDDMLAACLFVFGEFRNKADLPVVRMHLAHPAWYVRVQAATALGKLGTQEDEARLVLLFNDEQWWVRYRAGEALATLASMTENRLQMLQETLTTPEAQEVLAPVLAKFRMRHMFNPGELPACKGGGIVRRAG